MINHLRYFKLFDIENIKQEKKVFNPIKIMKDSFFFFFVTYKHLKFFSVNLSPIVARIHRKLSFKPNTLVILVKLEHVL